MREARGGGDDPVELNAGTDVGDAVQGLGPPLVRRDAEAGDGRRGVDELEDLLVQCEPGDEVTGPLDGGQVCSAEKVGFC